MRGIKRPFGWKIRISAVQRGKYIIPYLMADFMRSNPHVEISILEVFESPTKFWPLWRKNTTDLALLSVNLPNEEGFESIYV